MEFRQAEMKDIPQIMEIIQAAQQYLKEEGIDQWQNNYPNPESLKADIINKNSYLIEDKDKIIATAAVIFGDDPTYSYIEGGKWLSSGNYGVIHRAAVAENYKGQGIVSEIFAQTYKLAAAKGITSIRIDTHSENKAMQRVIKKEGFQYCGIIYTEDNSKRFAYEKLI
ncbi:L-amino acid N-acyltransferase YncA [Halanaerobium congolense]|uniref:L-amino acid N-acyltransferase YncA n=1 Tax=Halanaerobium congolense TaxID=54121 RepID=A0A1I0AIQ4_9FIRM|nr:GNAT family N-acetyltransferase [Halanaerobium congolense]PTX17456.1 L-amino acid N-acyltransferase YncA [Halanaerobium congolense]SDF45179.1 L-amino acid N-acyltransferase YncA [Halanaerobium congolense]SES94107.1 L-amino acid N-acyltransferase YncA [Halanaerobium congolense]SFP24592.1 L-amino acid N-acyltransferase YncA [Halanaerobium congolense]